MTGLLLDTCAIIYMAQNAEKLKPVRSAIDLAERAGELYVSPISAWEIGRLAAWGRLATAVDPLAFFNAFVAQAGAQLTELSAEILIASSYLPGNPHKDPMDRILMTTSRALNIALLTDDRAILAYGADGHIKTLAC